jgi:hypothetical protein
MMTALITAMKTMKRQQGNRKAGLLQLFGFENSAALCPAFLENIVRTPLSLADDSGDKETSA